MAAPGNGTSVIWKFSPVVLLPKLHPVVLELVRVQVEAEHRPALATPQVCANPAEFRLQDIEAAEGASDGVAVTRAGLAAAA
jgi:hypothetical protein